MLDVQNVGATGGYLFGVDNLLFRIVAPDDTDVFAILATGKFNAGPNSSAPGATIPKRLALVLAAIEMLGPLVFACRRAAGSPHRTAKRDGPGRAIVNRETDASGPSSVRYKAAVATWGSRR